MIARVVVAMSVLAIVISLVACGGSEEAGEEGEVTVTIWQTYNDEENAVFKDLVARFEELNPTIKIQSTRLPFVGAEPKIQTALITKTAPDIARVDVSFLPFLAEKRALVHLEPYGIKSLKEEIFPVALATCTVDGKTWGLPDQINCLVMFYNKAVFEESGLDPDSHPKTWAEFIDMAKTLTDRKAGKFGFGMRNSLWWTLPFFYTYGAEFLNDDMTECLLNSPNAVEAFQFKIDLYRKHKVEGGAWRAGGIANDVGFQNGKYAVIMSGPWSIKGFERTGIDFGVGLIPEGPEGTASNIGGNNLVVFNTSEHPAEAVEFLKFMASRETQAEWCNRLGQIPVNALAAQDIDFDMHPYLRVFMEQMKYAVRRPPVPVYPEIENLFNPEMQAALDGTKTAQQALDKAVDLVNELLQEE
jgi:multiple sugar transport system substrate-binding protein